MNLHMYHIEIVDQTNCKNAQYIGHPSPLGNPFPISKHSKLEAICDKYDNWFLNQINCNNKLVLHELIRLHAIGRVNGVLRLGCFSVYQRHHGETIKEYMTSNWNLLEEAHTQLYTTTCDKENFVE